MTRLSAGTREGHYRHHASYEQSMGAIVLILKVHTPSLADQAVRACEVLFPKCLVNVVNG